MAGSKEIRAGKAFVELGVRDKLDAGMRRASARLKAFGAGVGAIGSKMAFLGAAITAPLIAAAKVSADSGAALFDMSKRTGISVEKLSELGFAAAASGSSLEDFETSIKRMQKTLAGVADVTEGTTGSVKHLGLELSDLKGLSPDKQFEIIAERISAIQDPTERAAAAMKIFGRSGTSILPMAENLAELEAEARKLGVVRTTASAKGAKEFSLALHVLHAAFSSLSVTISEDIIPLLKKKTELIISAVVSVRNWVAQNRGLVVILFEVGTALTVVGTGLFVFGKAATIAGAAIGGFANILKGTGAIFGFLTNPISLVVVALGAAAAAWFVLSDSGKRSMGDLLSTAKTTFGAVADALASGEISLAAQVLWTGLKLAWIQGTQALQGTWSKFRATFVQVAAAAFFGAQTIWTSVSAGLQTAWVQAASAFRSIWQKAIEDTTKAFDFLERRQRDIEKARINADVASGKITRAQGDKQIANVDSQANSVLAARDAQDKQDALAIEINRQNQLAAIERDRLDTLGKITEAENAISDAAAVNAMDDVANLEQEKRDLLAKLAALRQEAANKSGHAAEKAAEAANAGVDAADAQLKGRQSQGTFFAAAIQALRSSPVQDRIAKFAEQTALNTERIARQRAAFA